MKKKKKPVTEKHTVQLKAEQQNDNIKVFVGDKEITGIKSVTIHQFETNKN